MKKIIILGILVIGLGAYLYQQKNGDTIVLDLPPVQEYREFIDNNIDVEQEVEIIEEEPVPPEEEMIEKEETLMANSINLAVPFTSQAPTTNWQQPFQDACEEASVLMVDYYYKNQVMPEPKEVEVILFEMVDWQIDNWGDHHNLTMSELADFITTTFGYQTELIPDLTPAKVIRYLDLGQPIIIPANGHLLDNSNFSGDGPEYHMLVIKGYQDNYFVTNDPGTRKGANFIYTSENVFASIAEWNQKESLATGPQIGLVIIK
ncbi:hypothetical protein HN670_01150 [bacterium]|nr:hypothetical protein [bacterium]